MKAVLAVSLVVFAAVGFALATAGTGENDDIDVILSDIPLSKTQLEGEHQANDNGTVFILIGIEVCNGKEI